MRQHAILLAFAFALISGCDSGVASPDPRLTLTVTEAPEWTALFDRDEGWTGGDGIFAVSLDGVDATGSAGGAETLFLFSDTAIGGVLPNGRRAPGMRLVNNTLAVLRGSAPDPTQATFLWREANGQPVANVRPQTPQSGATDWYWNQDAIVLDGRVHSLHLRIARNATGFPWRIAGVALASFDARPELPANVQQVDTPFYLPASGGNGDTQFGAGLMANTSAAQAPNPDGFVYIYGVRNDFLAKKLLVARVAPSSFADFGAWRFWDGSDWQREITAAAPIADRVSNELSVSPLADGRFILVHQLDAIGPWTAIQIGDSPVGPWGGPLRVYKCPEAASDPDTFCYNAKGFPHLSAAGELLISYNVNTRDFFGDFFADADIYRPRFIRLHGLPTASR